jgi:asparagine synthase (glutamine-hydrolysing)
MKQLCYAATPTGFLFASEAKAIFASGLLQPRADWAALDTYLAVGFVPAPASCFAGVRKLAAGSILVVDQSGVREQTFWRMRYRTGRRLSDEEHAQEMLGALRSAVRSHLAAEARIGAYLSGGWDSSILAALAADLVSGRLATFSVVLPDNPSVDERRFSRLMASHLGSEHHEVEFRAADVPRLLPDAVWYREEPFTGPALLELQLASLASRHVKAVLSGQGSDELLGGYPWQQGGERWYRLRAVVPPFAARLAAHAPLSRAWRLPLGILAAGDAAAADAEWMRGLTPVEKDRVLAPGLRGERPDSRPFRCHPDTLASCRDPLQRRMALDLTRRLADGLLATNDRMAMAHSLEVRMPFLDRAVVELSLALPSDLKVRGDQRKVVLGRLVGMLPTEIAARRKFGLQYPLAEYLRGPLRGFVREQLLESPGLGELLNRRAVERMLRRQLGGDHPDMKGLWALVVLAAWWRRFFVDYRRPDGHGPGNAVTR